MRRHFASRYMEALAGIAVVVGLGGCGDTQRVDDHTPGLHAEAVDRGVEPGEYVLIYRDAAFYEMPGDEARVHRAYKPDRREAAAFDERRLVAEVVEDHGEFVEVRRLPGDEELPCETRRLSSNMPVALRYFVHRVDLGMTVERPTVYEHDDGTRVEIVPGQPLEPHAESFGRFRMGNEHVSVTVDPSPGDLGPGFSPVDEEFEPTSQGFPLESSSDMRIGGESVDNSGTIPVESHEEAGDEELVRFADSCMRLTGRIDTDAVSPHAMMAWQRAWQGGRCGGSVSSSPSYYLAEPGTTVYWPQGEVAGEVIRPTEIFAFQLDDGDERHCQTDRLLFSGTSEGRASDEERNVEYCFELDELEWGGE